MKTLALKLLDGYGKHISSKVLLLYGVAAEEQPFSGDGTPTGFTGLHGAAYLGCVEIIVALLETSKGDVHATDLGGNTALAWAAKRGDEGALKVLLGRRDINPGEPDGWCRTPLWHAATNGHEGVIRILLERSDVNPDKADNWSRTPLSMLL